MRSLRQLRLAGVLLLSGALSCGLAVIPADAFAAGAAQSGAQPAKAKQSTKRKVKTTRVKKDFLPVRASAAQLHGLRSTSDALSLESSAALVVDQDSFDVLFSKNPNVALPIASITKLMTALVVLEANQVLDEEIEITQADLDTEKGTGSRLRFGTVLSRADLLHLALMSSENRAAHALGRNYPGGLASFVAAMNAKARLLGMGSSSFVDPTGLSSRNVASAEDLARLVHAASLNPVIREFSTGRGHSVRVAGGRSIDFRNTNALVANPTWNIALQKTGYIAEAGRCLVMQTFIQGKSTVIVLLDSVGKYSRLGDATRIRKWIEARSTLAEHLKS